MKPFRSLLWMTRIIVASSDPLVASAASGTGDDFLVRQLPGYSSKDLGQHVLGQPHGRNGMKWLVSAKTDPPLHLISCCFHQWGLRPIAIWVKWVATFSLFPEPFSPFFLWSVALGPTARAPWRSFAPARSHKDGLWRWIPNGAMGVSDKWGDTPPNNGSNIRIYKEHIDKTLDFGMPYFQRHGDRMGIEWG